VKILGPERAGGQGLDSNQEESGNRAILALLTDPEVRDQTDLVITHRGDAYEVWAARGMVRFQRFGTMAGRSFASSSRSARTRSPEPAPHHHRQPVTEECGPPAASGHPTRTSTAPHRTVAGQLSVRLRSASHSSSTARTPPDP